jgi:hypothetical protein
MTEPAHTDWSVFATGPGPLDGLDPVEFVGVFIPHFTFELQLRAISGIIQRNRKARADLKSEIDLLNQKGQERGLGQQELDDFGDLFYEAMYLDSAHSLVLSALMTAFLEEFFVSLYSCLAKEYKSTLQTRQPADPRWTLRDAWNPKVRNDSKRGLAVGIFELAKAIDLNLPPALEKLYGALTAYRNAILHNSLEWGADEVGKFTKQIAARAWNPAWFDITTTNHIPSMYALTDLFADELMATVAENLFFEVGKFLKVLMT